MTRSDENLRALAADYYISSGNPKADNPAYPLALDHDESDLQFWFLFPNIGISQIACPGYPTLFQENPISISRVWKSGHSGVRTNCSRKTFHSCRQRRRARASGALIKADLKLTGKTSNTRRP